MTIPPARAIIRRMKISAFLICEKIVEPDRKKMWPDLLNVGIWRATVPAIPYVAPLWFYLCLFDESGSINGTVQITITTPENPPRTETHHYVIKHDNAMTHLAQAFDLGIPTEGRYKISAFIPEHNILSDWLLDIRLGGIP